MKKKLKLNDLRVKSFVTNLNNQEKLTVAGGVGAGSAANSAKLACIGTNGTACSCNDNICYGTRSVMPGGGVCSNNCGVIGGGNCNYAVVAAVDDVRIAGGDAVAQNLL